MADTFVVSPLPDGSRPVSPETFSSVVHKLCAELDMPHVHLHSLRHFAATEMLSPGIDPRNTAEILGHANPTLTLSLFSHATLDRQRTAAEVLAARWCLRQRTHGAQDALRTISEDSHRASSGDPRSLRLTVNSTTSFATWMYQRLATLRARTIPPCGTGAPPPRELRPSRGAISSGVAS